MKAKGITKTTNSSNNIRKGSEKAKKKCLPTLKQQNPPEIEKTFNSLNDDCIEELLRRLPTDELAKMSMVNVRINSLSENLFKRLRSADRCSIMLLGNRPETERISDENIMKAFGEYIQYLQISGSTLLRKSNSDRLQMVNRYCGKNLQYLKICGFNIHNETAASMSNLIENIQTITLKTCSTASEKDSVFDSLLKHCKKLRHLNILSCTFDPESWSNRSYDHLESIFFRYDKGKTIDAHLSTFFDLNRGLKNVIIESALTHLPDNIVTNALSIENITFGINKTATIESFRPIFHLPHLKQLNISRGFIKNPVVCKAILEHFGAANTLESFGLCEFEITIEIGHLVANMTCLKALRFWQPQSIGKEAMQILSTKLVNVDTIFLSGDTFRLEMIGSFIRKFPRLKSLYVRSTPFYNYTNKNLFAVLIGLRRISTTNWYDKLTIYVRDNGFESRKLQNMFETNFLYNNYVNLVALSTEVFTSRFYGVVI